MTLESISFGLSFYFHFFIFYNLKNNYKITLSNEGLNLICQCFTATLTEGYHQGGEFVGMVLPRSETRKCKKHKV
jgi:hypothetical protein